MAKVTQLGYKAVCDSGLACSGSLTVDMLNAVASSFVGFMASLAVTAGVPRTKIASHVGCNWGRLPTNALWNTGVAAVTPFSQPGFSFYDLAYNPALASGL